MTTVSSSETLFPELRLALKEHMRKEIDKAVEQAKEQVETEIRKKLASIVMDITSHYDVRRIGNDLQITVHLNKGSAQ